MRIEKIPLARINPAPYNPREDLQPDDPDYIAIKTSIDKFGMVDPLVWNETTGNLVGGHQRYKIIAAGGATEAHCSVVHVSEAEEKELNFALNRAVGRWNLPRLEAVVGDLKRLEIDISYLRPEELLPGPDAGKDIIEDDGPAVPQEPRSRRGEVYGLGRHRLMCGDATSAEDVAQLMGGEKADAIITDPPYGIGRKGIANDDVENLPKLYEKTLPLLPAENAIVVAFQSPRLCVLWLDAIRKKGHKFERLLWYYKPNGMRFPWRGWILKSDVICVSTIGSPKWPESPPACHDTYTINHKYELPSEDDWHASIKPNEIMVSLIEHTLGVVYDPFGGSGSTLIACEQLGRRCRMMEIDPLYCDVIRDRYAKFIGEAPKLADSPAVPAIEEALPKEPQEAPKAPPRPTSAPQGPPERRPPVSDADICADPLRWPGSTDGDACFWYGLEGCLLADADRPLRCIKAGKGGNPPPAQDEEVIAEREAQWEHANAVPVPRTLFDGNAKALDAMPRDKMEASMACLDGGPRKAGSAAPPPPPALPPGIAVGEMDDAGNPVPDEAPAPTDPPTQKGGLVLTPPRDLEIEHVIPIQIAKDMAGEAHGVTVNMPQGERVAGREIQRAVAEVVENEPPTLEENAAQKGIFEALATTSPPRTADAQDVVLDFETPVETQPLPRGGHVYVKRDDLFAVAGVRGGKARTCWALATARPVLGLITAGSRMSPQCNIVAHVARRLGVPCRLHIPQAKKPLEGELAEAKALGAEIVEHPAGRNTVIIARAREDALGRPSWGLIPFGMECDEAVKQTRCQARVLERYGRICERIVVPVGSGMTLAGILHGMADLGAPGTLPVLGICVGADPRKRLDRFAPAGWRDGVVLKDAPSDYHKPAQRTRLGDLELDPGYEAKCLPYLKKGNLLWVVGIRNCVVK